MMNSFDTSNSFTSSYRSSNNENFFQQPPPMLSPYPAASNTQYLIPTTLTNYKIKHSPKLISQEQKEEIIPKPLTSTQEKNENKVTRRYSKNEWSNPAAPLHLPFLAQLLAPNQTNSFKQVNSSTNNEITKKLPSLQSTQHAIAYFSHATADSAIKFVYAIRTSPPPSAPVHAALPNPYYRPYDLTIVNSKKLGDDFYTISHEGIVHMKKNSPTSSMSLSRWIFERSAFNLLRNIRFFRHFLIIKQFNRWKKNVRYRIFCKQRAKLSDNLFLARPSFCTPLLDIYSLMWEIEHIPFSHIKTGHVYAADTFSKEQTDARNNATKQLESITEKIEEILEIVCKGVKDRARLYEHRIVNEELSNSRFAQHLLGQGNNINNNNKGAGDSSVVSGGRIKSMVAMKEEKKRRLQELNYANIESDMLSEFIRLVDYLQIEICVNKFINNTCEFLTLVTTSTKPLFTTSITFAPTATLEPGAKSTLLFSPTANEIELLITTTHDLLLTTLDSLSRIITNNKFIPFLTMNNNNNKNSLISTDTRVAVPTSSATRNAAEILRISRVVCSNEWYKLMRKDIDLRINNSFIGVGKSVNFIEKHRPVFEYSEIESPADITGDLGTLTAALNKHTIWQQNLQHIRDIYTYTVIQAETRNLKVFLLPITENAINKIKLEMINLFSIGCISIIESYNQLAKECEENYSSLALFAAYLETINNLTTKSSALALKVNEMTELFTLMYKYDMSVMISPSDAVHYDDMHNSMDKFNFVLFNCKNKIQEKLPFMRQLLFKNINKLNSDIELINKEMDENIIGIFANSTNISSITNLISSSITTPSSNSTTMTPSNNNSDDKSNIKELLVNLAQIDKSTGDLQKQLQTLQHYQQLFDIEPYNFPLYSRLILNLERKKRFYHYYDNYIEKNKKWLSTEISVVDGKMIEKENKDMNKEINVYCSYFNNNYYNSINNNNNSNNINNNKGTNGSFNFNSNANNNSNQYYNGNYSTDLLSTKNSIMELSNNSNKIVINETLKEKEMLFINKIKSQIAEWEKILPSVNLLSSPVFKPANFRTLFQTLNLVFYGHEKLKIKKLKHMNLFNYSKEIEEVYYAAKNEDYLLHSNNGLNNPSIGIMEESLMSSLKEKEIEK